MAVMYHPALLELMQRDDTAIDNIQPSHIAKLLEDCTTFVFEDLTPERFGTLIRLICADPALANNMDKNQHVLPAYSRLPPTEHGYPEDHNPPPLPEAHTALASPSQPRPQPPPGFLRVSYLRRCYRLSAINNALPPYRRRDPPYRRHIVSIELGEARDCYG